MKRTITLLTITVLMPGWSLAKGRTDTTDINDPVERISPAPATGTVTSTTTTRGQGTDRPGATGDTTGTGTTNTGSIGTPGTGGGGTDARTGSTGPGAGTSRPPIGDVTGTDDPGNAGATGGTMGAGGAPATQ